MTFKSEKYLLFFLVVFNSEKYLQMDNCNQTISCEYAMVGWGDNGDKRRLNKLLGLWSQMGDQFDGDNKQRADVLNSGTLSLFTAICSTSGSNSLCLFRPTSIPTS